MRNVLFGLTIAIATICGVKDSFAGATNDLYSCYRNADNSGFCSGSFKAFNEGYGKDAAEFYNTGSVYTFWADVADQQTGVDKFYSCTFPANTPYASVLPNVLTMRSGFYVDWDSNGNCNYLQLKNNSAFPIK
jgi:hypothetical protein